MKEISRDIYLRQLISADGNGLIKIVTGLRRCGKSYLLFKLFRQYLRGQGIPDDHVLEYVLDDVRLEHLQTPRQLFDDISPRLVDDQKYYILLDEIQLINGFEKLLNSLLHLPNAEIYVTGSNSRFLSSDIVTEFRGRGTEIQVHPLCFREFATAFDGSPDEAWDSYFNYGGMPLVLAQDLPEGKASYLGQLFQQVYLSDLVERHAIRNREEFDELLDILASATGSLTNPKKLSDTFFSVKGKRISSNTLYRYISYLQDAFLLTPAHRYDVKGKKYINTPLKFYFEDVGLRNIRLGMRQQDENHIMENILFNELKVRGCQVDVGVVPIHQKNLSGKIQTVKLEIDFIAYRGNQKYYLQSAYALPDEEKRQQERRPLLAIRDSFKKIIVVQDNLGVRRDDTGITTIGLRHFLLDPNSLDA